MSVENGVAALTAMLHQGDQEQCVAFFHEMPEKQRRSLAPECLRWLKLVMKNLYAETPPGSRPYADLLAAAEISVFATATPTELQRLPAHALPSDEIIYQVLLSRRPAWTGKWATGLLDEATYWWHWRLIRNLMSAGLMPKPDHPHYYLGMVSGIVGSRGRFESELTIEQCLLNEPDLLEDELWQLFRYEGGGLNSLANWDRFTRGQSWSDALLGLVRQGKLPRERLLHSTLDALDRDFNHYRAKWFASFHDALAPSPDEQRQFALGYLRLLGVSAPGIVSWALAKVQSLFRSGALEPAALVAGLRPALQTRPKGVVTKSLKLLEQVVKQAPACRREVVLNATIALGHEDSDVQAAALDLIDRLGDTADGELGGRIAEHTDSLAPSLVARLARWTPQQAAAMVDQAEELVPLDPTLRRLYGIDLLTENLQQQRLEIPAISFDGTDIPRLDEQQRQLPIVELDELIDVCARVIEDGSLVDDAERAIDALARLCGDKPDDFDSRSGPLRKRATYRLTKDAAPFCGIGPADDLCGLIYAWTTGHVIQGRIKKDRSNEIFHFEVEGEKRRCLAEHMRKAIGFLSRRCQALAERVAAGKPGPLLSAPTHAGGWIAADELVRRVNDWPQEEPHLLDVCLALLRLAPDGRAAALQNLRKSSRASEQWQQALRYALGASGVSIGDTAAYWFAAARARSPWSSDKRVAKAFPEHGPDAAEAAHYTLGCSKRRSGDQWLCIESQPPPPRRVDPAWVTVTLHAQRRSSQGVDFDLSGMGGRNNVGSIRWTATIWPQARESFFAAAALDLADNLDWWEAQWQNKYLLEPLLDGRTPLRAMGLLLLTLGLAAKEPGESGLATDIAIRGIEEGRLVGDNLGPMLEFLLPTGLVKPGRWQKTLAEIARVSPVHALVIQQTLQRSLRGDPDAMPRDFAKLLELLKELSFEIRQPITDEACRDFLGRIRPKGKPGKTAQTLLALETSDFSVSGRPLMLQVIARRQAAAMRE